MGNYIPGIDEIKKFLNDNVQPTIANILGISDEGKLAKEQARNSAQTRMNMGMLNQDAYEDTLRHLLLGAYTTSEGGFDIGKRIGGGLINFRELGEGNEGEIDINNNNLGKILAKFRISKEGGELRGDALKEQILEDAKMLAASVDIGSSENQKQIKDYLYGEDGLMSKLNNYSKQFKTAGFDVPNAFAIQDEEIKPMLSTKGRKLTNEEIKKQLSGMNKGGIMDNQMVKAFAIGGEVTDPISGNEVPEGSFPNEVRDDVPAMLSEGEYVVPADVLRFYGLKFFEDLRENAKIEIARMSQEGRIGGDPIKESQSLNDADVDTLESMMRNAKNGSKGDIQEMAKGGLIDKLAHTIKTDSAINQRLAKGGVVIKMAPGGLVTSNIYQDPTKMDEVIKKVQVAAKNNPALFQRLASKGVVLDKTNATMDSEEMLKENKPKFNIETGEEIVTANEGGLIGYSNGGYQGDLFNPYFYQKPKDDNTVDERYANESGEVITKHYKIVDGIKMLTGYTRDSNPDRKFSIPPLELPAGFNQLITTPTTEMDNLTATSVEDRDGPDDTSPPDTTAWADNLDMNNIDSVRSYVDSITTPATGLGKLGEMGLLGAAKQINNEYQLNVISQTTTNPDIKSYVDSVISETQKTNKNPISGFLRNLFTKPNKTQLGLYKSKQSSLMEKKAKDPASISSKYASPDLTGIGYTSAQAQQNAQAAGIDDSSFSPPSKTSISAVDMGRPDVGGSTSSEQPSVTPDDKDENDFTPFNKGGLATKKSKKSYNKGGYSTKKKINTGGLVQKKKNSK